MHEDSDTAATPWSAQTSPLPSKCPFYLDEKCAKPTTEHRVARLEEATAVWAAHKDCAQTKSRRHSSGKDLLPADRMWLDVTSGRQMVEMFPARAYLGRYRS